MPVIYSNFFSTVITDNPLTIGAATVNAAGLSTFPTVAGPDYAWLTLDPGAINGAPEIVKVTAHSSSATVVSVTRGQQGTTARSHPTGTRLVQSITQSDLVTMNNRIVDVAANRPAASSALSGYDFWATDTLTLSTCDGTGWIIMREPPQTYTPTWTGVTAGYTHSNNWYNRSGGYCDFSETVTMAGVVTGSVAFNLPVTALFVVRHQFGVNLTSAGVNNYPGNHDFVTAATSCTIFYPTGAAPSPDQSLSAAAPFTWKSTDAIAVTGRFRMNTPYL